MNADPTPRPRLHFERPWTGAATDARTHALGEAGKVALDTLLEGFAAAERLGTLAGAEVSGAAVDPDLLLERLPFGEEAARELRQLAEDLLRHVLGAEDAPSEDVLRTRTSALGTAVRSALEESGRGTQPTLRRSERERLLGEAGRLLREVALEKLDVDVAVVESRGGDPRFTSAPVSATAAHVRLLSRVLSRLEASLIGHELLALEREASAWWFDRWSAEAEPTGAFARDVREREWSLAERGTLFMGPVADGFVARGFADRLPPRQRRMTHALQASFPGVFVVRDRREGAAVLQETGTGRRVEVEEHDGASPYQPGWILLGRLYAFDGPIHLRSPGMAMVEGADEAFASRLAEAHRRGRRQLAPALALETLVSALTRDESLPRAVPPAHAPAEARRKVERATAALAAVGLIEDTDAPPESAADDEARPTRRYKVDATMGQWLGELFEVAQRTRRPGPARARAGAKRKGRPGG